MFAAFLAVGCARAAWSWLMPKTIVRMNGVKPIVLYVDIDTFSDRWLDAKRKNTFMPAGRMYLNPIQIMYATGRRR